MIYHDENRSKSANNLFIMLVPLAILLGLSGFMAQSFIAVFIPEKWSAAGYFCLFTLTIILTYFWLWLISPRANRLTSATARPLGAAQYPEIKYLVTGYSPVNDREGRDVATLVEQFIADCPDVKTACTGNSVKVPRFPWQQNIRVIAEARRAKALKKVFFIQPARDQNEQFVRFMKHYFEDLEIQLVTSDKNENEAFFVSFGGRDNRDYENFNYVGEAFIRAFNMITVCEKANAGWKSSGGKHLDGQVAIDVTPGYKIFSIVAAIQSLNQNILFFYAKTAPEEAGMVLAFDASVTFSGSPR